MHPQALITPYFFDQPEPCLAAALPAGLASARNDPGPPADRSAAALAASHRPIRAFATDCARAGRVAVSIAGDCMAALPVMAGLQQAGLAPDLVWLDAHGDFNTPATSPSGFLGGMPLAMMVGRGQQDIAAQVDLVPVDEAKVWLIGARDLDPLEAPAVAASRLNRATLAAFAELRLEAPVHLHIDNDLVDGAEVPANNYPVGGGPSLAEAVAAVAAFVAANRVCALSLSGWACARDRDGATAAANRALVAAALGLNPPPH